MSNRTLRRRAIGLFAAALIGTGGLYATFTDSTSTEAQDLNTADGSIEFTSGSLVHTVDSSVQDLVPGDSVSRDVVLHNGASYDFSTIRLDVADSTSGAPFTSNPEGLSLKIEREDSPGNWSVIYGPSTPTGNGLMADIDGPAKVADGSDHLRFTMAFEGPDTSKSLKGAQASIVYTFTATQRDGEGAAIEGPTAFNASYTPSGDLTSFTWTNPATLPYGDDTEWFLSLVAEESDAACYNLQESRWAPQGAFNIGGIGWNNGNPIPDGTSCTYGISLTDLDTGQATGPTFHTSTVVYDTIFN